jgi:hypothetical protein
MYLKIYSVLILWTFIIIFALNFGYWIRNVEQFLENYSVIWIYSIFIIMINM